MKNKVLLFVTLLAFATSCTFVDTNSPVGEPEPDDTYMSLRSSQIYLPTDITDSEGAVESITIESLRIMVFSKTTGKVVTNKLFDISGLPTAVKDPDTGDWVVDFSNIKVTTKPGPSIVYVVLNENIMSISGQTLTGALNAISTIAGMQTLVNTPLSYTNPLRVVYGTDGKPIEPPFIMSTFDEIIIPPNQPEETPFIADLRGPSETQKGFELDRTMAKVTLQSISSNPRYPGEPTNNVETSYIFILKVGLVNVPTQYLWSPNRLQTTPPADPTYAVPMPAYTGSYQTIDFGLEDPVLGYYDRIWNGSITATATAPVTWTATGSGEVYKIANNAGGGSYGTITNDNDAYGYGKPLPANLATMTDAEIKAYKEINFNSIVNSGNFLDYMNTIFLAGGTGGFTFSDVTFGDEANVTANINPAYWQLKQEKISYYVPEHILENKASTEKSTKLHVKAVIAKLPDINSLVPELDPNKIVWSGDFSFPVMSDYDLIRLLKSRLCQTGKNAGKYLYYWDISGFKGTRQGTITQDFENIEFDVTNSENIKDFYLPIYNTPTPENPVDYNIYRNHEYKFSVHALEQWSPLRSATSGTAGNENLPVGSMVLRNSADY